MLDLLVRADGRVLGDYTPERYLELLLRSEKCMVTDELKQMYIKYSDTLSNSTARDLRLQLNLGPIQRHVVHNVFAANSKNDADILARHLGVSRQNESPLQ